MKDGAQKQVNELTKENKELKDTNKALKKKVAELELQNSIITEERDRFDYLFCLLLFLIPQNRCLFEN